MALGWADGGYHPRAWGALLVAAGVVLAAAALLGGEVELDRRRAVFAGGLVALAAWSLVSRAWALAPDGAVLEAERTLAYAGSPALRCSRCRAGGSTSSSSASSPASAS